ncbi:unnamed protein product [Phaedon cochleariae]|uniref:Uncharacterized protein n=1 Tax=Phaedon cochleariae TaxID=80249 RepID=A0A9N9SBU3_PHACE|nr:unnamed protein product [Phaedon cochleariae]
MESLVGGRVWKRNYVLSDAANNSAKKLAPRYVLCTVAKKKSKLVYVLKNEDGTNAGVWHIQDLKLYDGSEFSSVDTDDDLPRYLSKNSIKTSLKYSQKLPKVLINWDIAFRETNKNLHFLPQIINLNDGMVILNEVNEKSFKTLNDLAQKKLQRMLFIFKKYSRCDSVFLVFDRYDIKDSIKDMERRGHHNLGIFSITGSRPVPNYRNFLKSTPNKMALIRFLSQYLMDSFKRLPGGKFLFIAGGSKDAESCFKVGHAN